MDEQSGSASQDLLKELLSAALELPADGRAAFVERAVSEHPEIGDRLRELVRAWDHATTMLRAEGSDSTISPIGVSIVGAKPEEMVGKRFDRYRIDAVLGSGGFGVVYRAHQDAPVRRDVALKVVRPGVSGSEFLSRFEAERQALARLGHPSIARIYDAGALPDGRPFFAMELVDGAPITRFSDDATLTLDERIGLFIEVCRAVQHAHQKGVIHRDLKPSNILVGQSDEGAFVKIIDFGIAKAIDEPFLDDSVVTQAQQIVGTPQYMSPEQAMGDCGAVDTRSDVFSLGVVLYELLCGARPLGDDVFRGTAPGDLGRVLASATTVRASARFGELGDRCEEVARRRGLSPDRLPQELAGELDWVAARAIDAEADRRYPTPAALADDLERYLADEAVEARPPSRSYLIGKFARRHKAAVTSGVGLAMMLLALIAVLLASLSIVREERNAAVIARQDSDLTLSFFIEVFGASRGDRGGRDITVFDAVESSLEWMGDRFADRPRVAARIHNSVGNLFHTMGQPERALEHLDTSIRLMGESGESETAQALLIRNDRAILLTDLGRSDELIAEFETLHEDAMRFLGPEHAATLLIKANHAGQVLAAGGDAEWAARELRHVVQQGAGDMTAGSTNQTEAYVTALLALNKAEEELGRPEAAISALRRLIEVTDDNPERWLRQRLGAQNNLATRLHEDGETEEALEVFESLRVTLTERFGPDHANLITVYNNIASAQEKLERFDEALATRDEVEALAARTLPPGHPVCARLLVYRADLFETMNRLEEAERMLTEAWEMYKATPGAPPPWIEENAQALASLYREMGRESDAEHWARVAGAED